MILVKSLGLEVLLVVTVLMLDLDFVDLFVAWILDCDFGCREFLDWCTRTTVCFVFRIAL